jgi:hypothetical protein
MPLTGRPNDSRLWQEGLHQQRFIRSSAEAPNVLALRLSSLLGPLTEVGYLDPVRSS